MKKRTANTILPTNQMWAMAIHNLVNRGEITVKQANACLYRLSKSNFDNTVEQGNKCLARLVF